MGAIEDGWEVGLQMKEGNQVRLGAVRESRKRAGEHRLPHKPQVRGYAWTNWAAYWAAISESGMGL